MQYVQVIGLTVQSGKECKTSPDQVLAMLHSSVHRRARRNQWNQACLSQNTGVKKESSCGEAESKHHGASHIYRYNRSVRDIIMSNE